ncbi:MAG: energy transducer TonB [Prevotella sp.]|nr:energy transducer TonB [Prevotella sp.]
MAKVDLTSNEWTDLVFQSKNKEYGAFPLRRNTGKRNLWSIIIMFLAAILGFSAFTIVKTIQANARVENTQEVVLSDIAEKKDKPKVEKKPEIKIPEQQKMPEKVASSVKFTEPVIKKDNLVKEDNQLKQQEDLSESTTKIGALDVKGNDEGGEVLKVEKAEIEQPKPEPKKEEDNKVFDVVEQQPAFPGGQGALLSWLSSNIHYPAVAEENGIQGRVVVSFVVEKDGSISNVQVVRGVDPSLDKEAARVVKSMPKWTPGKQNGQAVRVKYNVPVTFKLQ